MRRKIDPEGKRQAILDAAVKEYATRGFHGANTARIAKDAGVAVGTLFRIFNTKEGLANAVFRRCRERYSGYLQTLDPKSAPRKQFAVLFQSMVGMYFDHPHDFVFYEIQFQESFLDDASRSVKDDLRRLVRDWIAGMQKAGILKPWPPDVLRAMTIGGFVRLVRESEEGQKRLTQKLAKDMEQACWDAIAVDPVA